MSRIDVNLLWCVPGDVGGSEQYLARQLRGLAEHDHGHEVHTYALPGLLAAQPGVAAAGPVVEAPFSGRSRPLRVAAEHSWLAWRSRGADLVHHGGGTVPAIGTRPVVLTIHDLQYLAFPHYFSRLKGEYLRRRMPRAVRRAAVVTVPSEFVKGTVVEALDVAPERVVVVPHGVEPELGVGATPADELRARYGLGERRVLVLPAATFPHKGHRFLLDLLAGPWADGDLCLVFIGGRGLADAEVTEAIDRLGVGDRVVRPGRVPTADRDGLIRLAEAVVFPSQYEGFGAPVIEAMTLGTPVIASDLTAVPEVLGDAGLCLPLTIDAWADALDRISARRADFVARGLVRAERFSCRHSAAALLDAYRLALG